MELKKWYYKNIECRLKKLLGKKFRITTQVITALLCVGLIVYFMPRNEAFKYEIKEGYPWEHGRIEANFDFTIKKSMAQMQWESDSVRNNFAHCFRKDSTVADTVLMNLLNNFAGRTTTEILADSATSLRQLQEKRYSKIINDIYSRHTILPNDFRTISPKADSIRLITDNSLNCVGIKDCMTIAKISSIIARSLEIPEKELQKYIVSNIIYEYEYSQNLLNKELEQLPTNSGIVRRGQTLINRGDLVDAKACQILTSYKNEIETMIKNDDINDSSLFWGQTLFVTLCFTLLLAYIYIYADEVSKNNNCFMFVMLLVTIFPIIVGIMVNMKILHVTLIPLTMTPMLLSLFTTKRTAFLTHTISTIICSIMLNQPYEFILLQIPTGLVAMLCMKKMESRLHIFICAFCVFASYSILYLLYRITVIQNLEAMDYSTYLYFAINAILLTLAYPLMFLVEKVFGFISNVTLMELSNINSGLLLKLSQTAPGTFNHSMQVGNLASEAALSIGANSLEVRVGALYHDIGKMKDPIYFTENQSGGISPHSSIPPEASTLIIKKHVSDGLELGHGLPRIIRDYIATHHGTSKTGYFYITYKNAHPDEEVDDQFFSYPGPKPFTREQAILMLADSVEAAARSIKEYTEENINQKVESIVNGKIDEGELSDSPLTLREISIIKEVFKKRLKNIHHTRISYPTENKPATATAEKQGQL